MTKHVTIGELFTDIEMTRAVRIYREHKDTGGLHITLLTEIVRPAMARINETTGQENDPDYMAYVLEYALQTSERTT